jgi:hypothetical protein
MGGMGGLWCDISNVPGRRRRRRGVSIHQWGALPVGSTVSVSSAVRRCVSRGARRAGGWELCGAAAEKRGGCTAGGCGCVVGGLTGGCQARSAVLKTWGVAGPRGVFRLEWYRETPARPRARARGRPGAAGRARPAARGAAWWDRRGAAKRAGARGRGRGLARCAPAAAATSERAPRRRWSVEYTCKQGRGGAPAACTRWVRGPPRRGAGGPGREQGPRAPGRRRGAAAIAGGAPGSGGQGGRAAAAGVVPRGRGGRGRAAEERGRRSSATDAQQAAMWGRCPATSNRRPFLGARGAGAGRGCGRGQGSGPMVAAAAARAARSQQWCGVVGVPLRVK